MKRMYVTLGVMFLLVFWATTLLGQQKITPLNDPQMDGFEKRMRMREEIHRRMMEKLLHGTGPDQDLFSDMEQFLDEAMKDSFSGTGGNSFGRTVTQNYQSSWNESATGRTLIITPSSPDQHLDINVEKGMVTIKGKTETKTSNGTSVSNFSNSFNIPGDCDPLKVKIDQKEGKILVYFPYTTEAKPKEVKKLKEEERKPLPPSATDVQI